MARKNKKYLNTKKLDRLSKQRDIVVNSMIDEKRKRAYSDLQSDETLQIAKKHIPAETRYRLLNNQYSDYIYNNRMSELEKDYQRTILKPKSFSGTLSKKNDNQVPAVPKGSNAGKVKKKYSERQLKAIRFNYWKKSQGI